MERPDADVRIGNPILRYLFRSWVKTCGEGWTGREVLLGYAFSLLFPAGLLLYAHASGLHWSLLQQAAAALIAWDLSGGAIGYNHPAMKRRRLEERNSLAPFHHNLQHIHPLILIFFTVPHRLLWLTIYWLVTFFLYVEFLEADPATGARRIGRYGQMVVIGAECAVAALLVAQSFHAAGVPGAARIYGIAVYGAMLASTGIVIATPLRLQRTGAMIALIAMLFAALALPAPEGFGWLIPVYFLKLLVGFTAKEAPIAVT